MPSSYGYFQALLEKGLVVSRLDHALFVGTLVAVVIRIPYGSLASSNLHRQAIDVRNLCLYNGLI